MKRWWIYGIVVVVLLLIAPISKTDVGDLLPVELVHVSLSNGDVYIETDTENLGVGRDLEEAIQNLHQTSAGKVFLETADYLVVSEEAEILLPKLIAHLRPGTEVCKGDVIEKDTAAFLSSHKPRVTLNEIRAGDSQLQTLILEEGRYRIE